MQSLAFSVCALRRRRAGNILSLKQRMNGLPSKSLQLQPNTILFRCVQILRAAFYGLWNNLGMLHRGTNHLCNPCCVTLRLDLVVVAACRFGVIFFNHCIFAASFRALQQLEGVCNHGKDFHPSFAGVRDQPGDYMSRATAMLILSVPSLQ